MNTNIVNSKIPNMSDITLKGLQEFYSTELVGNTYMYIYKYKDLDKNHIKAPMIHLTFKESNMCHLLGIQHIVANRFDPYSYVGQDGFNKITNDALDIPLLKSFSKTEFKNQKDRFRYFTFIKDIVADPDLILYNSDKNNSNVKSKYILYKLIGHAYVHLGIDTVNHGSKEDIDICFPRTLLIEKKMSTRFIDNQTELLVQKTIIK